MSDKGGEESENDCYLMISDKGTRAGMVKKDKAMCFRKGLLLMRLGASLACMLGSKARMIDVVGDGAGS